MVDDQLTPILYFPKSMHVFGLMHLLMMFLICLSVRMVQLDCIVAIRVISWGELASFVNETLEQVRLLTDVGRP